MRVSYGVVSLALLSICAACWPEEAPIRLTFVPIKEAFDPWDPVILYIEAENVSVIPYSIDPFDPWDIDVLQKDGEQVPWTRYGEERKQPDFEGGMGVSFHWAPALLHPGEVESYVIQLDRWVDLSQAGTYSVRLRRWVVPGGTEKHPLGEPRIASSDRVEFRIEETSQMEMEELEISEEVMRNKGLPADFGRRHPKDGPR